MVNRYVIYLLTVFIMLINYSCINKSKKNFSSERNYYSLVSDSGGIDLFANCKSDSIIKKSINKSDLSLVDTILVEYYIKGSLFKQKLKSNKGIIFKQFNKIDKNWSFSLKNDSGININYDLIFIIPMKNDSDFYYLSDVKLSHYKSNQKENSNTQKVYFIDSYNINGEQKMPGIRILNFFNPYKKRQ